MCVCVCVRVCVCVCKVTESYLTACSLIFIHLHKRQLNILYVFLKSGNPNLFSKGRQKTIGKKLFNACFVAVKVRGSLVMQTELFLIVWRKSYSKFQTCVTQILSIIILSKSKNIKMEMKTMLKVSFTIIEPSVLTTVLLIGGSDLRYQLKFYHAIWSIYLSI